MTLISPTMESGGGLIPVYRNIPGIPAKALRQSVEAALHLCEGQWPDELPEALRRRYGPVRAQLRHALRPLPGQP